MVKRGPDFGPKRRYDRAPAPVKVAVSILYVQMGLLVLAAVALNVTLARTPGGETSRWPATGAVLGVAVFYGLLSYRLLQGREWARLTTVVLTGVTLAVALGFFQVWLLIGMVFWVILLAGLLVPESRRFFADPEAWQAGTEGPQPGTEGRRVEMEDG